MSWRITTLAAVRLIPNPPGEREREREREREVKMEENESNLYL